MKGVLSLVLALCLLGGCAKEPQVIDVAQTQQRTAIPGQTQAVAPSPTPAGTPAPYITEATFIVECEDGVNLRESSSSKSAQIGTLQNGDRVMVLGYQSQRFARVQLEKNGQVGYAIAGYLRLEDYSEFGLEIVKPQEKYSYEQMLADTETLAQRYTDLCSMDSAGESVEGRELRLLVIGNVEAPHHVFVQGAIHARDHMSALLCVALAEKLLQQGGEEDVCFHILPMSNPDGVTIQQGETFSEQVQRIYTSDGEKGLSVDTGTVYLSQWQANANGVDLNRNFDALWENIDSTEGPSFMNYRGEAPGSEPETQALMAYTDRYDFDATISYHATGSAIYWEFGEDAALNAQSLRLAEAIKEVSAYEPLGDSGNSFGGYKDWAMLKRGIPSVTIEVGTRAAPLTETEFSNIFLRNLGVFPAVAELLRNS